MRTCSRPAPLLRISRPQARRDRRQPVASGAALSRTAHTTASLVGHELHSLHPSHRHGTGVAGPTQSGCRHLLTGGRPGRFTDCATAAPRPPILLGGAGARVLGGWLHLVRTARHGTPRSLGRRQGGSASATESEAGQPPVLPPPPWFQCNTRYPAGCPPFRPAPATAPSRDLTLGFYRHNRGRRDR